MLILVQTVDPFLCSACCRAICWALPPELPGYAHTPGYPVPRFGQFLAKWAEYEKVPKLGQRGSHCCGLKLRWDRRAYPDSDAGS
eukprot:373089-Rhodomonas_salina.1